MIDQHTSTKTGIINSRFKHLKGHAITVTEASEKYDIPRNTVLSWASNYNYISVLKSGYRMELDEADVAYVAAVYHQRKEAGTLAGAPLLNDDGSPYELKHPSISEYRRNRRRDS